MIGRSLTARLLLFGSVSLVLAFLMLPILAVVTASLSEARFIQLPPHSLSTRWYEELLADGDWRTAFLTSLQVAAAVTLLSVALGTSASLGLQRLSEGDRRLLLAFFIAPLIVPAIVTAIAVYRTALDLQLNSTLFGMILSHGLLAVPFVIVNVGISLRSLDETWLKAAAGLGASPWTIFRTVTLPNIAPGILGGAIFAFITSFDEVTLSLFMSGTQSKTLPIKIWEFIRFELTPVIPAAATVLVLLALLLFAGAALANGWRTARRP